VARANRLRLQLVQASYDRQATLLDQLRDGDGSAYTNALAAAIPQLTHGSQARARDALVERLETLNAESLRRKLADASAEVRGAAAVACGLKGADSLVPDLIALLEHEKDARVMEAGCLALKRLTGKDRTVPAHADKAELERTAAAWVRWWKTRVTP
jgi:HEAT repeat protein